MASRKFECFFELPGELREQILAHLVVKPAGIHLGEHRCFPRITGRHGDTESGEDDGGSDSDDDEEDDGSGRRMGWPVNYFLVSQTFYREASSLFFGENTFHLYAGVRRSVLFDPLNKQGVLAPPQHQSSRRHGLAGRGSAARYLPSRRRVKHAVIYIQRLGGSLSDVIVPCLQDMILVGGLRHLDVRVSHLEQQGADKRATLWNSTPARILVRLLCDPDLEFARLRAYFPIQSPGRLEALAGWCPLRKEQAACNDGPDTRQWVIVDVEELSRRYGDGEANIRKAVEERSLLRWAGA